MPRPIKYTWIEELEDQITMAPVLDENGDPVLDEVTGEPTYTEETVQVGTNGGNVTAFNRDPVDGERGGTTMTNLCVHGYNSEFYRVVDGVIQPVSDMEERKIEEDKELKKAYNVSIECIDDRNRKENVDTFPFEVRGVTYNFVADIDSFIAIETKCLKGLIRGTMTEADPVPAPGGKWKTDDTGEDGITPIYVDMSVGEFLDMTDVLSDRGIDNFGVKEMHKNNIKQIMRGTNPKAEDLETYKKNNLNNGWK